VKPITEITDWASGYVTEVVYTQGYYRELSPLAQRFALVAAGFVPPQGDSLRYCELGFGQGLSLNFHAATQQNIECFGFDINPAHVAIAQDFARDSQSRVVVSDDSFADLLKRDDLPRFDYISLHGVWSWINDENRGNVVEFIRRHLNVGGVVYVSYNSLPGWAHAIPLRRLLTEYASLAAAPGNNVLENAAEAMAFAQRMAQLDAGFFHGATALKARLESMAKQQKNYLVHEYFNRDWHPMYFSDVANLMAQAKLEFAAPVSPIELIDALRIAPAGIALLAEVKQPMLRETMRDFLVNQQFRRDLFIRGARRLSAKEQKSQLDEMSFVLHRNAEVLLQKPADLSSRAVAPNLREALVKVLDAQQGRPMRLDEIARTAECADVSWAALRQALIILVGTGEFSVAHDEAHASRAAPVCRRLNGVIVGKAGTPHASSYLCSPITGGGVQVGELQQMLLHQHWAQPELGRPQLAKNVWQQLSGMGQRVVTGGTPCDTPEDNLAALGRIIEEFFRQDHPMLKKLGIA
jgi:hypothetical protein